MWSRVLVVADDRLADWTVGHNEVVDRALRDLGCAGGLSKVVVSVRSLRDGRGRGRSWRDLEVALDNVDLYGMRGLDVPFESVVLASVTGQVTTTAEVFDETQAALEGRAAAQRYLAEDLPRWREPADRMERRDQAKLNELIGKSRVGSS